jgi:hypothetical protein
MDPLDLSTDLTPAGGGLMPNAGQAFGALGNAAPQIPPTIVELVHWLPAQPARQQAGRDGVRSDPDREAG